MIAACSLNKSFGAAGGAIVFPDAEMRRRVKTGGGPMMFSGPIQPPLLGAAIESAKIHLSDELPAMQAALRERVELFTSLCDELGIPLATTRRDADPLRPARPAGRRARRDQGDPRGRLLHEPGHVPGGADEARRRAHDDHAAPHARGHPRRSSRRSPSTSRPRWSAPARPPSAATRRSSASTARRWRSSTTRRASALNAAEWNSLLGERGTFTVDGLQFLERAFGEPGERPEDQWAFHYYVVRDRAGKAVLATFFTAALWKDDMLSAAEVSELVEARRAEDPYYLTSTTFAMGSLLTEGDHLYLDRNADWKGALDLLMAAVSEDARAAGAGTIVFRDLYAADIELAEAIRERGYVKTSLPAVARVRARGRRRRGVAVEALGQGARAPAQVRAAVRRRVRGRVPARPAGAR